MFTCWVGPVQCKKWCRESAGCQWYWEGEGVRSDDAEDAVLVSSLGTAQGPG